MNKKILIIGSRGMLGQELIKIFPEAVDWDRAEIDITDKEQIENKIKNLKPEVIINCAAYNAVDACEEPEQFFLAKKINGDAVGYLADVCLEIDAALIHYSTNYVFAGDKLAGYAEEDKPQPLNKYGETKLRGEQELLKRPNLKYYLIRTSKLFGEQGTSELAKENFFAKMLKLADSRDELQAVDDELSNFTYAPDLAQATKDLLTKNYPFGIYHLINENPGTWYQAAQILFDITGKKIKLIKVSADAFPRSAERPKYAILLNTKLPKLRNYEEALNEFIKLESL
ncbi:MAG: dTDP-4-dehydrorhamnose reductase [Patescibacteria group bacterium]